MIGTQDLQRAFEFGLNGLGVEPVMFQPATITRDLAHQFAFPGDVSVNLLAETFHAHPGSPLGKFIHLLGLRDCSVGVAARKHGNRGNKLHYARYRAAVNWLLIQSRLVVGSGG